MAEVTVTIVDAKVSVAVCDEDIVVIPSEIGPQGPRGSQLLSGTIDPSISIGLIGDQYINTNSGFIFGPKTADGWGEGTPLGSNDPENLGQIYWQTFPSAVWDIVHTLTFIPNITIVDSENRVVEGDYEYIDANRITATFNTPISGKAYLS